MTDDQNPLGDPNTTPEDVATLYSWANLHGAKYRDFSAARAQTREMVRLRAEKAAEEQRRRELGQTVEPTAEGPTLVSSGNPEILSAEPRASRFEAAGGEDKDFKTPAVLEGERQRSSDDFSRSRDLPEAAVESSPAPAWPQQESAEKAAAEAAERARLSAQQAREEAERAQEEARRAADYAAHLAAERAAQLAAVQAAEKARAEAEEKARAEAEERARLEVALAKAQADEQARRDAEQAAHKQALAAAEQEKQQAAEAAAAAARQEQEKRLAPSAQVQPQPLQSGISTSSPATHPAAQSSLQRGREYAGYGQSEASPDQPQSQRRREESSMPTHTPWAEPEAPENGRPAWLSDKDEPAKQGSLAGSSSQAPAANLSGTPEDTLQGSRDRLASRWYALRGLFEGAPVPTEPVPPPVVAKAPATAIFSLAGGVGKTSLVATLGRALSARGERVLLVDTAAFGLMPFFFGAMDQRPGSLRTFNPPGLSNDAPIQLVTIDADGLTSDSAGQESLAEEIGKFSRGVNRVIIDLATASGATTRRVLRMSPLVVVPLIPDMNSVVSVSSIDAFFEHNLNAAGKPSLPFYVLNQFDTTLPLHLDVREVLREQLGDRLLPFALHRAPAMSEALAEGMTVIDYAPGSTLAEDFSTLAGWVKSLSAPAVTSYRGVRWSER